jgi:hypothetical protein
MSTVRSVEHPSTTMISATPDWLRASRQRGSMLSALRAGTTAVISLGL